MKTKLMVEIDINPMYADSNVRSTVDAKTASCNPISVYVSALCIIIAKVIYFFHSEEN